MNTEDGLGLKFGDRVWTIGVFECLWMPYRVVSDPVSCPSRLSDENIVIVNIVPENDFIAEGVRRSREFDGERMNAAYLSRSHPLGWQFIRQYEGGV